MTWQTRTICTFVAASIPLEKAGDVNPLLEAAQDIGRTDNETDSDRAPAQAKDAPFDPENPPIPDNSNGSFERFLGSFGNPTRWAGR